jgi:hypothetical protein
MNYPLSRLRYFNGQFLLEKDFTDQQDYHIHQEELHRRTQHVWGICEGLSVSLKAGDATKLVVDVGAAVDGSGHAMLLAAAQEVTAAGVLGGQSYLLVMAFNEVADNMAAGQYVSGNTRYTQKPLFQFITAISLVPGQVVLARLSVALGGAMSNLDASVRTYAGVRLPGRNGAGFDLRAVPVGQTDSRLSIERFTPNDATLQPLVTVTSAGAVGVGDTAPAQKLVVGGNVGIGYNQAGQTAALAVNGNVGIGTVTPTAARLQFSNDLGSKIAFSDDGRGAVYGLGLDSNNLSAFIPSTGSFSLRQGGPTGTEVLKADAKGNLTGTANDYTKAQFTLNGGGLVTWEGLGGSLKWTVRFIAICMGRTSALTNGHINVEMPPVGTDIALLNGTRKVTAAGILLNGWDALYAVHGTGDTQGGPNESRVTLRIVTWDGAYNAPSNWVLVAVANADDGSLKLGTGTSISPRSSVNRGSVLPSGVITMWSGAENAIPFGWALCNGQNGTPDLRNRFIVGAGSGSSYQPGWTGGADTVTLGTHQMPPHSHGGSVSGDGSHRHVIPVDEGPGNGLGWGSPNAIRASTSYFDNNGNPGTWAVIDSWAYTRSDGGHWHGINGEGGGQAHENRPPYFALCFIMKL